MFHAAYELENLRRMNKATDNLIEDHTHIIELLDIMDRMKQHSAPEVAHLEKVVVLIQNYADGLTITKKKNCYFL
jgi:hemerythrin-like domain-containing protein